MKKTVYIIHGFHSNQASGAALARHLKPAYNVVTPDLAISFQRLEVAVNALQKQVSEQPAATPLVFIGHSTGGLVIRRLLKQNPDIARRTTDCIFIAVPNQGTPLAELQQKLPSFLKVIHSPVNELTPAAIARLNLQDPANINYAGLYGTRPHSLTNYLFSGSENDGVVAKKSVVLPSMKALAPIDANHTEIMSHPDCLAQVASFLNHGRFS